MTEPIALVTCGPPQHGISRFGQTLARAAVAQGFRGCVRHEDEPDRLFQVIEQLPPGTRLVHLQVNDWLFADRDSPAADRIADGAERLQRRGMALSVTLHDLPQQAVARDLFLRRARTYLSITDTAVGVIVCSGHERQLMHEAALAGRSDPIRLPGLMDKVRVIPLPVDLLPPGAPLVHRAVGPGEPVSTVGILGFIYPGKGHREVLDELSGTMRRLVVLGIGRPSDGHAAMLNELGERAAGYGIAFECTGFVPDAELAAHLRAVSVPVAPHPQVSASASINAWIGAGRRPLVLAGRYTRELAERMPGAVWLYRPGQLRECVEYALDHPELTMLGPESGPGPSIEQVSSEYLSWLRATVLTVER